MRAGRGHDQRAFGEFLTPHVGEVHWVGVEAGKQFLDVRGNRSTREARAALRARFPGTGA